MKAINNLKSIDEILDEIKQELIKHGHEKIFRAVLIIEDDEGEISTIPSQRLPSDKLIWMLSVAQNSFWHFYNNGHFDDDPVEVV